MQRNNDNREITDKDEYNRICKVVKELHTKLIKPNITLASRLDIAFDIMQLCYRLTQYDHGRTKKYAEDLQH